MSLSLAELKFIERREMLTKLWPVAGTGMLGVLGALAVWLWIKVPYLINPWTVLARLQAGTLPESTAHLMVAMLPVVMLTLLSFAFAAVFLAFVAFSNERRLIRLIRKIQTHTQGQGV